MKPINNTNSFSLRRLIRVIRIDLSAYSLSHRMYIGIAIIFWATQLGALRECITFYKTGMIESAQMFEHFALQQAPVFYSFLFGMMLFSIATAYGLGEKSDATYYLSIPATNVEKFVSRAMIAVVEPIVMTLLALLTADLARIGIVEYRMAVNPDYAVLTDSFKGLTIPHVLGNIQQTAQYWFGFWSTDFVNAEGYISMAGFEHNVYRGIMMILFGAVSMVFIHSLFLAIGLCWTNFTAITVLIIGSAFLLLKGKAIDAIVSAGDVTMSTYGNLLHHEFLSVALLAILSTLTIVNWRLSYRAFTRKQVVMPENFLAKSRKRRKEAV